MFLFKSQVLFNFSEIEKGGRAGGRLYSVVKTLRIMGSGQIPEGQNGVRQEMLNQIAL